MFVVWFVLSALWCISAFLFYYAILEHLHMHSAVEHAAERCLNESSDNYNRCFVEDYALYLQRDGYLWWIPQLHLDIFAVMIGPPLVVLGAGATIARMARRFRRA